MIIASLISYVRGAGENQSLSQTGNPGNGFTSLSVMENDGWDY